MEVVKQPTSANSSASTKGMLERQVENHAPLLLGYPAVLLSIAPEISRCCREQVISDSLANSLGVAVPGIPEASISLPLLPDVLLDIGNFMSAGACRSVTTCSNVTYQHGLACSVQLGTPSRYACVFSSIGAHNTNNTKHLGSAQSNVPIYAADSQQRMHQMYDVATLSRGHA